MVIIESIDGKKKNVKCIGCAIQKGILKRYGGLVTETKYFDVQQDYEVPIPGFFVIASKRHIVGFADFNKEEKKEFIDLICKLRKGMKEVLKIKYISLLFREDIIESKVNPSHFHIALLPKYDWMKKLPSNPEILKYAIKNLKTKDNLKKVNEATKKIKKYFN